MGVEARTSMGLLFRDFYFGLFLSTIQTEVVIFCVNVCMSVICDIVSLRMAKPQDDKSSNGVGGRAAMPNEYKGMKLCL